MGIKAIEYTAIGKRHQFPVPPSTSRDLIRNMWNLLLVVLAMTGFHASTC